MELETNQEKVLAILLREGKDVWLPVYAFQSRHGIFVGHKAQTRLLEIKKLYPDMIEGRKIEDKRTYEYRIKYEDSEKWFPNLPDRIKRIVLEESRKAKLPVVHKVKKMEFDSIRNVMIERELLVDESN